MQTLNKQQPVKQQEASRTKRRRVSVGAFVSSVFSFLLFLVFGCLLLELVFNIAGVGQEEFLEPDAELGVRHIANKPVVWRLEGYSAETLSSKGLRDTEHSYAKPARVTRVALLGDSATEGLQVGLADTYGKQLEKMLNGSEQARGSQAEFEVINFGCSSYSTGQQLLQLQKDVSRYNPDYVVLLVNRGDNYENVRDSRNLKVEPRPYFWLTKEGVLRQDDAVMQAHASSFTPSPWLDFLRFHSRLYGVLTHTDLALNINEKLYQKLRKQFNKLFFKAEKVTGTMETGQSIGMPGSIIYPIQDPLAVTSELISSISSRCEAQEAKLIVLTFPNLVKDPVYQSQIDKIKRQSGTDGFAFLDLTACFQSQANPNALFIKYHFSEAGHKLVAEELDKLVQELRNKAEQQPGSSN